MKTAKSAIEKVWYGQEKLFRTTLDHLTTLKKIVYKKVEPFRLCASLHLSVMKLVQFKLSNIIVLKFSVTAEFGIKMFSLPAHRSVTTPLRP